MALTGYPFPYDIENLLGGAVRILYADADGGAGDPGVPADLSEVIDMDGGGYAPVTNWTDLGATRDSFTYTRGFDTEGWEIQQLAGNVIEEITDLSRTMEISFADLRPEHLAMIEGAPAPTTIAAAAGKSAQKKIAFGSFVSLKRYRFAFISQRPQAAGLVVQTDAAERGRFFAGVAYSAQLSADEVEFEQDKGALTAVGVTFTMFPEEGEPRGEEYGTYFDEQAGTIA